MSDRQDHDDLVVHHAGLVVRAASDPDALREARALLERIQREAAAPLVDEAEQRRLDAGLVDGMPEHHHSLLARRHGVATGYAGVLIGPPGGAVIGDVAVDPADVDHGAVVRALLDGVTALTGTHAVSGSEVWLRHAGPNDVAAAIAAGYAVRRRLAVLGRTLRANDQPTESEPTSAVDLRVATSADAPTIVAVLDAAYRATADGAWTVERFSAASQRPGFAFSDILLATEGDDVLGLHWTRRRDATTGEVHNLAVSPTAQGRQLGRKLLHAGLAHLAAAGCTDALLWVDLANEAAVRLYVTAGFTARWEDVAFTRHVHRPTPLRHA